jgi:hypothetical protein
MAGRPNPRSMAMVWRCFGVSLVVAFALGFGVSAAAAQNVWTDCGNAKGMIAVPRGNNFVPYQVYAGIEDKVPEDTWVQCRTPVFYVNWYPGGGRPPVARGTTCPAAHCAVIVDVIVAAAQFRVDREIEGKAFLLQHSGREETCGVTLNRCSVQEVVGDLSRGQSDYAVCGGWGGPFKTSFFNVVPPGQAESISVYCSAWMVPNGAVCPPEGIITAVGHTAETKSCQRDPKAPQVPKQQRPSRPGEMPQPPGQQGSGSGGSGTNPKPDCDNDDLDSPPPDDCYRVTVQIIPSYLPSDPSNETVGEGVGSATLQPAGETLSCLNPADTGACVLEADVAANTAVTVAAQPGSIAGDPSSPADSAFYKFGGACTGTAACTFTPTASGAVVDVYFIPAMATLMLQEEGGEDHVNMSAEGVVGQAGAGFGTEPVGPVYCGFSESDALPCSLLVRVDNSAQVSADSAGDESVILDSFSSNCPQAPGLGPEYCDVVMNGDQTVIADFGDG